MLNRPFSSVNTNIIDEKTQQIRPGIICGQNVLVSQEQHQKMFNTLTTSIAGVAPDYPVCHCAPNCSPFQNYQLFPQQNCPNVVTFTFGKPPCPPCAQMQPFWQCQTVGGPGMQSLNQLQQVNAVDLMQLQNQFNQPPQWRFHLDNHTSTSDLTKAPQGTRPHFGNLAGNSREWPYWLQTPPSNEYKKLTLKNVTAKLEGNVYDGLDKEQEGENSAEKKVTFDMDTKKEIGVQVQICCQEPCCSSDKTNDEDSDNIRKPKSLKKKQRKKSLGETEFFTIVDDSEDDVR